jgi:hypothetical protein
MTMEEADKYFYPVARKLYSKNEFTLGIDEFNKLSCLLGYPDLYKVYIRTFAVDDRPLPADILDKLKALAGPYGEVVHKMLLARG